MSMFTWRPIHEETAQRLLAYENRQGELIALLAKMAEQGMNVIPVADHPTEDTTAPLTSIDPFTFFAVFNRQLTLQNRRKNWQFLKEAWNLKSAVPDEFNAIPTITPQNSWFFGWGYLRNEQDIPRLWKLARTVLQSGWEKCDAALFEECLNIRSIGVAKLTTGLFWIIPTQVLPLPATTVQYLKAKGITVDVSDKTKSSYDEVMKQVRVRLSSDFIMESHKAWLYCQSENDQGFDFDETLMKRIWSAFQAGQPAFVDFRNPGEHFRKEETEYKRAGLAKFNKLGGRAEVARLVAANEPVAALDVITKSAALNIASFQSWRPSIGSDQPAILAEVLEAFLEATKEPYSGPNTLLPVFDALERNNLKPAWDTLSVILWALRPTDYFPIKISYYRELAEKLGCPLPPGRPDAHKFDQIIGFLHAFWKVAEPKHPADWVDVQSFLWKVCQNYSDKNVEPTPQPATNIWLIAPGERARLWESFQRDGLIGIGWDFLGDLKDYTSQAEIEAAIKKQDNSEHRPTNNALACWEFANVVKDGDLIVAKDGRYKVVGIGRITSGYIHEPERDEYHHLRKVKWLRQGSWNIDDSLPLKTLTNITPYPDFVRQLLSIMGAEDLAVELLGEAIGTPSPAAQVVEEPEGLPEVEAFSESEALAKLYMDEKDFRHILAQLKRKKNVILQGPPGVGKTFVAQTLAYALLGEKDTSRVQMVQFHQSYGYEEFIQGLRPTANGSYVLRNGIFYSFCERARDDTRDFVFIIDEINRGNLSKILGELMMLIEYDKRSERYALPLAYSDPGSQNFHVPPNVHILGLMNTADRSLAMVDYALRRRFAFVSLKPEFHSPRFKEHLVGQGMDAGLAERLIVGLNDLNEMIRKDRLDLGEGFCIGHSYFCSDESSLDRNWIEAVLDFEIKPLLLEYWMEGPEKAEKVIDEIKTRLL